MNAGNIMISTEGSTPILMDFGSLLPSPQPIETRTAALAAQDTAAEHSTLPYRAPELFDVKTGSTLDTSVDIWSLGCTIYCALYGVSPFDREVEVGGGSLNLAITSGKFRFPDVEGMREQEGMLRELVSRCLKIEPAERPTAKEVRQELERILESMD